MRTPPATQARTPLVRDAALVLLVAAVLTAAMAWPVAQSSSTRLAGADTVGLFRDPFLSAAQFASGALPVVQPATDVPAMLLAKRIGGIAAYNWAVLITFPLAAVTAWALAMALTGSRLAAAAAAFAFAWSPFHLAHTAYHVHIAQVQWWPLFLLATWRLAVRPSFSSAAWFGAATAVLGTASYYWAMAALVLAPFAFGAVLLLRWLHGAAVPRAGWFIAIGLAAASAALLFAAHAIAEAAVAFPFQFAGDELAFYSARWYSFFIPSLDHPWLGDTAAAFWSRRSIGHGLLEQQIGVPLTVWLLALLALIPAMRVRSGVDATVVAWFAVVGVLAGVAAIGPEWRIGGVSFPGVPALVHEVAPMFRAFARFGVIVALALAVLAGIGLAALWRRGRIGRACAIALALLWIAESAPAAPRWREVLPNDAYRALVAQTEPWRVFDCTAPGGEYGASLRILLRERVLFRQPPVDDCGAPALGPTLAALGATHAIVRTSTRAGAWLASGGRLDGLLVLASYERELLLRVTAPPAVVYTSAFVGFYEREFGEGETWRWMPASAHWFVMNATGRDVQARLEFTGAAFAGPRTIQLSVGNAPVATVVVHHPARYSVGPIRLPAGESRVGFAAMEGAVSPLQAGTSSDPRPFSVRIDTWRWTIEEPRR